MTTKNTPVGSLMTLAHFIRTRGNGMYWCRGFITPAFIAANVRGGMPQFR